MCFILSFKTSIINVFLVVVNAGVIERFFEDLSRIINNKWIKVTIVFVNILIIAVLLLTLGYYPVSKTLQKLHL